ncbi:MAG: pyrroline-5-carboxylate reductase [Candidatus Azotimanducaceae bacterium]|jgi:pyrroline-5-carboxylate reductase
MPTIAFLGAGNIAQAIMGGLIASTQQTSGSSEPGKGMTVTTYDPVEVCTEKAAKLGAEVKDTNANAIRDADIVMLCVKPDVLIDLLRELASECREGQLFVSVAAGITCASMKAVMPDNTAIVRCMPNTPALVKVGMTGMYASDTVTVKQKQAAQTVMAAVGETLWVTEESDLDAVTAVSGSGPAYYFLMMELMIKAAIEEGLEPSVAKKLVLQTALGAATMASASLIDPAALRLNVTSPGGTTQAALEHFNDKGLGAIVSGAVNAARVRSVEMSKQ